MRVFSLTTRALALLVAFTVLTLAPAHAGKKPPLTVVSDTAWVYSGFYKTRAKKTGLRDFYSIEFIVDFFSDGFFTLQDFPLDENNDVFGGTWQQVGNKTLLFFDQLSQQILAEIFAEQFDESGDFEGPVDVFVERWEIKTKLKLDRSGQVFMKFKERLRHVAIADGIPIRVKTAGNGERRLLRGDRGVSARS